MREIQNVENGSKSDNNEVINFENFLGFLHFHTTWSDGINSLEEMINAALNMGYKYAAVCDHSKSAFYANGLSEERILLQRKEIVDVEKSYPIKLLSGIECDILSDGELDYSDDILSEFNFVVASVHSRFNLAENEMTDRIIKAVENPYTNVLGHPTGRLLLSRAAYQLNIKKVIDACSRNNVAIEINSNPHRLDLDWRNIQYAKEKECLFSINQDAHSIDDLENIKYGIGIARKGEITPLEVINCFDIEKFIKFTNK